MEDYPRSLMDLQTRSATEVACREYVAQLWQPKGCACVACGANTTGGRYLSEGNTHMVVRFWKREGRGDEPRPCE